MDFREEYSSLFAKLGFALSEQHGTSAAEIQKAEHKLGTRLPQALRDCRTVEVQIEKT